MDIDKREIIKGSQLFWGLTDSQVDKLVELCQEKSYAPGERIFNVGDKADYLYIVVEGKIALEMALRVGRRTRKQATLDVIEKGEAFGWSAPFSERLPTLNMSAISTEKTSLIYFKGTDLHHLYYDDIDLYCKMIEELIFLVSGRLDKAKKTLAQVLSIASHDLRAPLATVQSCMDVLSGGFVGEINEKQRELIAGSKHRIADLTAMIDNILDISHIEISDMDFESTSLSKIIAGSSGDIQGMADKKQIQLVNDIPEDLPPVLGVPKRLHQVLNNLLSNAVKFTLDGGKVTIRCRATEDSVRVEVSDTGIGIPKEELTKVFDDFYRGVQVDTEGAGIGLGIAKKIV
ncbi:MAG: sensor histidine kinase, partial [Deltaproteobacteria bacterium]